jgi:NADH-quinone oxidoreductase E subunit
MSAILHHTALQAGHGDITWTESERAEIAAIVARYPTDRSAIMPVLWKAQEKWEWLSYDVMRLVANTLHLPPSHVLSVATFYTMFKKAPTGKFLIQVCHTLSCELAGSERLIDRIKATLGISEGETTPDGKFTLMRVECLASCGSGPMAQINEHFYELLTDDRIDAVLNELANGGQTKLQPEAERWTYPAS